MTDHIIHVSKAKKRDDLGEVGSTDGKCPDCGAMLEIGFGMAGGGYGTYEYCEACGEVETKTEERSE